MHSLFPALNFIIVFVVIYAGRYGGAALIERNRRDSERWQARSARQRRIISRTPGLLLGLVIMVLAALPWGH